MDSGELSVLIWHSQKVQKNWHLRVIKWTHECGKFCFVCWIIVKRMEGNANVMLLKQCCWSWPIGPQWMGREPGSWCSQISLRRVNCGWWWFCLQIIYFFTKLKRRRVTFEMLTMLEWWKWKQCWKETCEGALQRRHGDGFTNGHPGGHWLCFVPATWSWNNAKTTKEMFSYISKSTATISSALRGLGWTSRSWITGLYGMLDTPAWSS